MATGIFALAVYDSIRTVQIHGPLYAGIVQGKDLISNALPPPLYIVESYLATLELLIAHPDQQQALISQFKQLEKEFNAKQAAWRERLPPGPLRNTFESSGRWVKEFYDQWNREFLPAVEQGDTQTMTGLDYGPLTSRFQQHRREILELVQLADAQRRRIEHDATSVLRARTYLLGLLGLGLIGTIFVVGWLINRHVSEPLIQGLRESEERTRSIVDTALDAVIVMDDSGKIADWNPQAEQIFGWPRETIIGARLSDAIIPLQFRETHEESRRRYLRTGEGPILGKRREITALRRAGTEIAVELAITPLKLANRTTFSAFVRDVSERKQAEQALRRSDARLRLLVERVTDYAIIMLDSQGLVTTWNVGAEPIKGYTAEEILGQSIAKFYPPEAQAASIPERFLARARAEGRAEDEGWRIRKDGSRFWANVVLTALRDNTGEFFGFAKLARDLTERKQVETELRQAKETAEAATVAKSQFLANMSHEIRTPMNGVLGMTELLLILDLTERQRHLAETVHRSGTALLRIINDILDFSKIEAGKLKLEQVDVDMRALCEEVAGMFAEPLRQKGLAFVSRISEAIPAHVCGDPVRLQQILLNLLSNAVKFTDKGEIALAIDLVEEDLHEVVVRLEVRDSGIGIPPDAQRRISQPFDQADASTTRKYGGTGLGLAIVSRLVEMMNGRIGVASSPGLGTTFWALTRLPKTSRAAATTSEDPSGATCTSETGPSPTQCQASILLAEDNAVNREVALGMLELLGFQVQAVENGRLATEAVAERHYDLILMDCQMPEMDGFAATRMIRAREQNQGRDNRTPIIALTANAMEGDRERCLASGMDDYLPKPFGLAELETTVRYWVSLPAQRNAMRPSHSPASAVSPMPTPEMPLASDPHDSPVDTVVWKPIRELQRPGQPDLLRRTIDPYLTSSQKQVNDLRRALQTRNQDAMTVSAHSLKTSSATLGAHRPATLAAELEGASRAGHFEQTAHLITLIEMEYQKACVIFRPQLTSPKEAT